MTGKIQTRKYSSYENDTTGNSQNCSDTTEKNKTRMAQIYRLTTTYKMQDNFSTLHHISTLYGLNYHLSEVKFAPQLLSDNDSSDPPIPRQETTTNYNARDYNPIDRVELY